MLTKESLKGHTDLSDLTDKQLEAITLLSANDENEVISKKTREIHTQYDEDIAAITGVAKPSNMKTYDHLKSELKRLFDASQGSGVQDLKTQIESLKAEKQELQSKIEQGGGNDVALQTLNQKIADKENEITQLRETFESEKTQFQQALEAEKGKMLELQVNQELDSYLLSNSLKFKDSIPESVRTTFLQNAKQSILSNYKTDFIEGSDGTKEMVLRDGEGKILWNKEKGKHFTVGEFYLSKITELIDTGKTQLGTGSRNEGGGDASKLDLSAAKTQVEATTMINNFLMETENLARTDKNFSSRQAEIYEENKVAELPLK